VSFEGEAEGMRLSLVDVGFSGANEGWDAVSASQAWVGAMVKAPWVGDGGAEGTEDGGSSGSGVFGVMTAIRGPEERGVESVGNMLEETEGVWGLRRKEGGGGWGEEEGRGWIGVMRTSKGETGGGEEVKGGRARCVKGEEGVRMWCKELVGV